MNGKKIGNLGEEVACKFLKRKGYKILERNFTKELSALNKGEIDIIAKKDGIICFVEVKASVPPRQDRGFFPEDRVDFKKQQKLKKLGQMWLAENKIPFDSPWQIDVIAVNINISDKKAKVRHLENAVS